MNVKELETRLTGVYQAAKTDGKLMTYDFVYLASNPNTPKEILEELCEIDDVRVNCALLKNPNLGDEARKKAEEKRRLIEEEAVNGKRESDEDIVLIMEDSNTSPETLAGLYKKRDEWIDTITRFDLAGIEDDSREWGMSSEEYSKMLYKEYYTINKMKFFNRLLSNSNTPQEILEEITKSIYFYSFEIDSEERYEQIGLAKAIVNCTRLPIELKRRAQQHLEEQFGKSYVSGEKSIQDVEDRKKKEAQKLMEEWDEEDYHFTLDNIEDLDSENFEYFCRLAENSYVSEDILEKISKIKYWGIYEALMQNTSLRAEVLIETAKSWGESIEDIEIPLLQLRDLPESVLDVISQSEDMHVILALIGRERSKSKELSMQQVASAALHSGVTVEDVARLDEEPNLEDKESGDLTNDDK